MRVRLPLLQALVFGSMGATLSQANSEDASQPDESWPDYLIVGAGGAGLQTAVFLRKYGYSFRMLEKESTVGSFWTKFPVFGELISVNKWVKNETQRFRYDWHSLLETPLSMLDFSGDYFPQGKEWHEYMNAVAQESGIVDSTEFGVEVKSISGASDSGLPCVELMDGSKRCARRRIFVGTGLREKEEPIFQAIGGIPYSKMTKAVARRRGVCVLGNGNAGFEVTENVYGVAERVTMYGNQPHRLSSITKYTGDVRVKFLQVLENLHGKLLDTVEWYDKHPITFKKIPDATAALGNGTDLSLFRASMKGALIIKEFGCEVLVLATGFKSHVPGMELESRFPKSKDWYESEENKNVHYIGWLMHERDFRQGAGGFLSGYRYLIRNLVHHIREDDFGIPYPYTVMTKEEVLWHILKRIQVADDLIILQDGVVVRDIAVPTKENKNVYHYYEGISHEFHDGIAKKEGAISLYFAWGDGRTAQHVFEGIYHYTNTNTLLNIFLHPVIEVNGVARALQEDLGMAWIIPGYVKSIVDVVRRALDGKLESFTPRPKLSYERTVANLQEDSYKYEKAAYQISITHPFRNAVMRAIRTKSDQDMAALRRIAKKTFPELQQSQSEVMGEEDLVTFPKDSTLAK